MAQHHYLGALAKIGETAWYVATWREQWVAQLSFSAAALKCGVSVMLAVKTAVTLWRNHRSRSAKYTRRSCLAPRASALNTCSSAVSYTASLPGALSRRFFGGTALSPAVIHRRIVLRDNPVRLVISCSDSLVPGRYVSDIEGVLLLRPNCVSSRLDCPASIQQCLERLGVIEEQTVICHLLVIGS